MAGLDTLEHKSSPIVDDLVNYFDATAGVIDWEKVQKDTRATAFKGLDYASEVNNFKQSLPALFESTFAGKSWEKDRHKLSQREFDFWQKKSGAIAKQLEGGFQNQVKSREKIAENLFKTKEKTLSQTLKVHKELKEKKRVIANDIQADMKSLTPIAVEVLKDADESTWADRRDMLLAPYKDTPTFEFASKLIPEKPTAESRDFFKAFEANKEPKTRDVPIRDKRTGEEVRFESLEEGEKLNLAEGETSLTADQILKGDESGYKNMTWNNAANLVDRDFGTQDPMGNIMITPQLAGARRIAQDKLVEHQASGDLTPLAAVRDAINYARAVEKGFWANMGKYEKQPERQDAIKADFMSQFNYVPTQRPR